MNRLSITALVALLAVSACAGIAARDNVLLPAMRAAWPPISKHVEIGVAGLPAEAMILGIADAMSAALDSGDRELVVAIDWPILRESALQGILVRVQRGEISEGIALSLAERVTQFDNAFWKLGERL